MAHYICLRGANELPCRTSWLRHPRYGDDMVMRLSCCNCCVGLMCDRAMARPRCVGSMALLGFSFHSCWTGRLYPFIPSVALLVAPTRSVQVLSQKRIRTFDFLSSRDRGERPSSKRKQTQSPKTLYLGRHPMPNHS